MFGPEFLQAAIIGLPVILLSLTVHEFFHAWTAHKFGDDTAKNLGRMSLNPIVHIDLMGLIVMVLAQFRFGWAKPVPVNLMNLRNPRFADIWISAAGPLSNMGLAIITGLLFRALPTVYSMGVAIPEAVPLMLRWAVQVNIALAVFNLIPLFPLDGSHILRNLLPPRMEESYARFDSVAPIILLGLVFMGAVGFIIGPVIRFFAPIFMGA